VDELQIELALLPELKIELALLPELLGKQTRDVFQTCLDCHHQ
jgi:hypothetical protein